MIPKVVRTSWVAVLSMSPYGEQLEYKKIHTLAPFKLLKSIFYPLLHISISQDYN